MVNNVRQNSSIHFVPWAITSPSPNQLSHSARTVTHLLILFVFITSTVETKHTKKTTRPLNTIYNTLF